MISDEIDYSTLKEWKLSPFDHPYPEEEGFYLTLCFTMGRYRYPRLVRLLRGKTGKLFSRKMNGEIKRDYKDDFFNCSWIKIVSPNGDSVFSDRRKEYSLGWEWK